MKNYVWNCTQTWVRVSKFAHAHDHVSQKVAHRHVFLQWTLSFESDIVSCVKSWIQRRVRKLNSSGGTSFRLQMWVVRWKRWCHMLNVTHRHIFVSQVCRHSSCSVRTCAWTRLVDDTFVWKRGNRDKTWEIRWQVANRHVLVCDNLHTETSL